MVDGGLSTCLARRLLKQSPGQSTPKKYGPGCGQGGVQVCYVSGVPRAWHGPWHTAGASPAQDWHSSEPLRSSSEPDKMKSRRLMSRSGCQLLSMDGSLSLPVLVSSFGAWSILSTW